MEQISAITAKKVLPVGENCKNELIEYYHIPEKKILVLNNFVNETLFFPSKEVSSSDNCIKILFSGRLEERKGLNELKNLSDYFEKIDGFELHIACHNETNTEIFSKNKQTHIYIGLTPEKMPDFYNSGDILYFPTHYEGFSMATLEALSCGIPVVGTKWAVSKELQDFPFAKVIDEKTGVQQTLENIKELYEKFKDKREEMHSEISLHFGKKQYEEKLLALIMDSTKTGGKKS